MEQSNVAYLLTGSNLGERAEQLHFALQQINAKAGKVVKNSAVYETEPWGVSDQPPFLNQVVQIETTLEPLQLLTVLQGIEKSTGSVKDGKWGKRILDIDLLFYNNLVMQSDKLKLPHPHLHERNFTLIPLRDIAPEMAHPVLNKTISELAEQCEDTLQVKKLEHV